MTSQTLPKPSPAMKDTGGLKMLIMAGSLTITLAGWGVLAAGQRTESATPPVTSVQSSPSVSSSTTLRQVNPPVTQFRSAARTRSSR